MSSLDAGLVQSRSEIGETRQFVPFSASPVHALQDRIAWAQDDMVRRESVWTPLARIVFTLALSALLWSAIGLAIRFLV